MIQCLDCRYMHQHADPSEHRCRHIAVKADLCREAPVDCIHFERRLSIDERAVDFETSPPLPGRWMYADV